MTKLLFAGVALIAWLAGQSAIAADYPVLPTKAPPPPIWSWTGFYAGAHVGSAIGRAGISDPYGASIFGDTINTPGFFAGAQVGFNWELPNSNWVVGTEADLSWLDSEGTNTCFAATGEATSSNCRSRPNFSGTWTGRVGYTFGYAGQTMVYAKGGAAFLNQRLDASTNYGFGVFPVTSTSSSSTKPGWTVGAGVEHAITPAWSVKLEYDYLRLRDAGLSGPATFTTTPAGFYTPVAALQANAVQDLHEVKLGLNYRFGVSPWAQWASQDRLPAGSDLGSGWEYEVGGRYWFSSGRFQKDLPPNGGQPGSLISRLTYDDLTAHSAELFARVDGPWKIFVQGHAGGGALVNGHMNDEDWGLFTNAPATGYSNTLSNLTTTTLGYATIDVGYDLMRSYRYKLGAFVGYNFVSERYSANTCSQIASPSSGICSPAIIGPDVIRETDNWHSLRVGVATEAWLNKQIKLSGNIAYLPYVYFTGVDNHWLRDLVISESGTGRGVQMEAILSYQVAPRFSIGVGARYWAMWTGKGSDSFNGVPIDRTDTYRYERLGALLQASYQFE
jgi:opacity protein-like surface antigen/outer membrane protease